MEKVKKRESIHQKAQALDVSFDTDFADATDYHRNIIISICVNLLHL